MTEEEKKALDILNNVVADEVVGTYCLEMQKTTNCAENCKDDNCFIIKAIDTVTNLIDKQEKEIEELKNNELDYTTIHINGVYEGKKIYKDKIKEKIEDYTEKSKHPLVNSQSRKEYTFALKALEELLEDNI